MSNTTARLKIGEGKISGYVAIFLGLLSFFGVVCFSYPEWLTTPEFREIYTGESMKLLLTSVIIASCFFAALSFILSREKKWALIGMLICTLSIIIGGFSVQ